MKFLSLNMFPIIISSIAINTSTKFCLKTTIGARANIRPDNKVQYSILPLALYSDVRRALIPLDMQQIV